MLVREIMTPGVEWVSPDTPLLEVARMMRDRNIGCLPVGEKDNLIGMITDRDIACRAVAEGYDPTTTKAKTVMSEGVTFCFDDQDISEAAKLMEEKQIQRLPILSHDNKMIGFLSFGDLAMRGSREVAGEVAEAVAQRTH
jgi:CBS domain-containing protein